MEFWPGVEIQRGIMARGQYSTWNHDPGSQFNVELWPGVTIQRGNINMTRGHNSTWNHDPGSQFNVEFWPGVTIQRGIMTHGHNSISYKVWRTSGPLQPHPYTFYKSTLGPQYVSNRPYNEFITPTTFILSRISIFNGLLPLDLKYAVTWRQCCDAIGWSYLEAW